MRRLGGSFLTVVILGVGCSPAPDRPSETGSRDYSALTDLFGQWREFQQPRLVDGVPDYSREAMANQHQALAGWQTKLAAIDTAGWPIPAQVDYRLVEAEMHGLDFDHRVLRPWERNPAFYATVFWEQSDQPAREGPFTAGGIELWSYRFPLDSAAAAAVNAGLRIVPPLLDRARTTLTGTARDLWIWGAHAMREQAGSLGRLEEMTAGTETASLAAAAREATSEFAAWLDEQAPNKAGPSGIGIENYDWYLRHVALVPYTWDQEVTLVTRELGRARAFLALAEIANRDRPVLEPVASAAEFDRRFPAAVRDYLAFLSRSDLMTLRPWHEAALLERIGQYRPGPREFFGEVDYRDPMVMRTHGFHWFDLARMRNEPHPSPIRRGPLLYNMFITRTEGFATGWEEMMLEAGMFADRPRSDELIYMLVAQRAARALGDLMMHANRFSIDESIAFASANTPRGWLRRDGGLVGFEQHLYLQQPAYGTSYLIGKMEVESLLADWVHRAGPAFSMHEFMDRFEGAGLVPMSMIRWELTGVDPMAGTGPAAPR